MQFFNFLRHSAIANERTVKMATEATPIYQFRTSPAQFYRTKCPAVKSLSAQPARPGFKSEKSCFVCLCRIYRTRKSCSYVRNDSEGVLSHKCSTLVQYMIQQIHRLMYSQLQSNHRKFYLILKPLFYARADSFAIQTTS